ncbi:EamA family transporter RarD, partial [Turicimonas muris]
AAAFAGVNWWINIYGVNSNQVVELGIGMFLTPLISVFLGVLFYKEKLPPLKWASILLAFLGLLIMVFQLGRIPWIAVGVSSTWAIYGALKKKIKVDPWISNTIESGLMLPLALVYIFTLNHVGTSHFFSGNPAEDLTWVLVSTGVITTIPMVAFSYAALNLPLNVLGFCMYINPILTLLVGIFIFKEPFNTKQLLPLSFIWSSIILFLFSESRTLAARR